MCGPPSAGFNHAPTSATTERLPHAPCMRQLQALARRLELARTCTHCHCQCTPCRWWRCAAATSSLRMQWHFEFHTRRAAVTGSCSARALMLSAACCHQTVCLRGVHGASTGREARATRELGDASAARQRQRRARGGGRRRQRQRQEPLLRPTAATGTAGPPPSPTLSHAQIPISGMPW